jgi:hypothetical protein
MYLAYRLIHNISLVRNPNRLIVLTINRYMIICFIMTITVGIFTFITTNYKNTLIQNQSIAIQKQKTDINKIKLIASAQESKLLSNQITNIDLNGLEKNKKREIEIVKQKQNKLLEKIYFNEEIQKDPLAKQNYQTLKTSIIALSDSLTMPLKIKNFNLLRYNYTKLNDSLTNFSIKLANKKNDITVSNN